MKNRYLLGASVALAMTFAGVQANAQLFPSGPGAFYFGGEGGWTDLENQTDRIAINPVTAPPGGAVHMGVKYNDGFNVGARAGYQWGPWRFEEEYSYRQNGLQSFGGAGKPFFTGDRTAHALMTNVIYDFTFGWPITPHLGIGVGAVDIVDSVKSHVPVVVNGVTVPAGSLLHGDDWVFGYQAIAGLEYNINPDLALDLDYRYLATTDGSMTNKGSPANIVLPSYKTGYSSHNFLASLIVRFGPPPPVAPPAAAPAPPPPPPHQVYLVFFDWDRYNITPEGMQIIRQAADHWRSGGRVRIEVTGYTDLSGSASYNLRLSQRRANAVAHALESFGVPRSDMAVRGLGEANPRVPTAQGVREPQNRRVEIVFP